MTEGPRPERNSARCNPPPSAAARPTPPARSPHLRTPDRPDPASTATTQSPRCGSIQSTISSSVPNTSIAAAAAHSRPTPIPRSPSQPAHPRPDQCPSAAVASAFSSLIPAPLSVIPASPPPSFLRRQESMRPSNTRPQHHAADGPPIRPHARSDRPSAVEYPTYARHPSVRLDSCLRRNDGGGHRSDGGGRRMTEGSAGGTEGSAGLT